jgi:hypothetical protein
MLDTDTKRRIDTARDILVGKVPDPKSQVEQITIALIYKFMDDMDAESEEFGGKRKFFADGFARYVQSPDLRKRFRPHSPASGPRTNRPPRRHEPWKKPANWASTCHSPSRRRRSRNTLPSFGTHP